MEKSVKFRVIVALETNNWLQSGRRITWNEGLQSDFKMNGPADNMHDVGQYGWRLTGNLVHV